MLRQGHLKKKQKNYIKYIFTQFTHIAPKENVLEQLKELLSHTLTQLFNYIY